jgi:hypothetical protein
MYMVTVIVLGSEKVGRLYCLVVRVLYIEHCAAELHAVKCV